MAKSSDALIKALESFCEMEEVETDQGKSLCLRHKKDGWIEVPFVEVIQTFTKTNEKIKRKIFLADKIVKGHPHHKPIPVNQTAGRNENGKYLMPYNDVDESKWSVTNTYG